MSGAAEGAVAFPHVFSPLVLGDLRLPNRLVMGSMHTGLEHDRDRLVAFYRERARGEAGLIITGGFAPNAAGRLDAGAGVLATAGDAAWHRPVVEAVHQEGGRIALQVLHSGRYGTHEEIVGVSELPSPLTRRRPRVLTLDEIERTLDDFARTAGLAREAGYDAVEIMGCEGYLINQFLAPHTNTRTDDWGGTPARRRRFAVEVVRRVRASAGEEFPVVFRLSLADLVPGGQTWPEVLALATELEAAGVSAFNTGVGWHEARVPTVGTHVPRGTWLGWTSELARHAGVPVCASNRISTPALAEKIVASGQAALVAMARPYLADPELAVKARQGRPDEINVCIGCNQACLDRAFVGEAVSCLVNPRACHETLLPITPAPRRRTVAVVGAGPAGMSAAITAAERGLDVTLFERDAQLGGQFRLAMAIPGKEDFADSLRYFTTRLERLNVEVRLATQADGSTVAGYDEVVVATGVRPRVPDLPGVGLPGVATYAEVLSGRYVPGHRVAVLGAGGIGVDVCHWLTHSPETTTQWLGRWGVDERGGRRGDLSAAPAPPAVAREVTLFQRKPTAIGRGLGKTSGWVHRRALEQYGVTQVTGVTYRGIRSAGTGLAVRYTTSAGENELAVDSVVLCTGQESVRDFAVAGPARRAHVIGGAALAAELDAERAIRQGATVAARL